MAESAGILDRFSALDRSELEKAFVKKALDPGETLCRQGEQGKEMYIVLSGELEVRREKRKENEYDVVARLGVGEIAGETGLIGKFERNATLVAKEKSEILMVDRSRLDSLKKSRPDLVFALYEGIIEQVDSRFRSVSDKRDTFSFWFG